MYYSLWKRLLTSSVSNGWRKLAVISAFHTKIAWRPARFILPDKMFARRSRDVPFFWHCYVRSLMRTEFNNMTNVLQNQYKCMNDLYYGDVHTFNFSIKLPRKTCFRSQAAAYTKLPITMFHWPEKPSRIITVINSYLLFNNSQV